MSDLYHAVYCVKICFSHLEWREDSLCVYFAHMKNDQCGERKRDPLHVYANTVKRGYEGFFWGKG